MGTDQKKFTEYRVGDEVSFATPNGMLYGEVVRIVTAGENGAVEIEYEDGRRETKRMRDHAMRLLRRRTGVSELEEQRGPRTRSKDDEIQEVRRSDQRRRW
ncbi:MAG TPA: hypothetical protein PKZ53_16665 [Acidobacteriota bacterium]|nr:hypothetical protein [Acidobacteriota bacterium]HNB74347.1 hypothetical protein [Acidobacteriota bacterium]HNG96609.1 hypothetical protein [Acidobacteriota bacterium]HNJ42123.1 hypothetical protein [Acidobacteriota bacterium]